MQFVSSVPVTMPALSPVGPKSPAKSAVHKVALGLVWLVVASGAVVFSEPAPVDLFTIGMIFLLPLIGLLRLSPALLITFSLWLLVAAGSFIAAMASPDIAKSVTHSTISLYLYFSALIFAAFIAARPLEHTRLIMNAYLWAAGIAALAGLIGYFHLLPGAAELFTKYGRAAGPFKDPNVYGPFLIPALLYGLHLVVNRPFGRSLIPAAMSVLIGLALLLSFSRGAWMALVVGLVVWGYMSFVTVPTNRQRFKLIAMAFVGLFAAGTLLSIALQADGIADLFAQRATLDQSYDYGPDGRFGGQEKAKALILTHPLGLGAKVFAVNYHPEEVHNVYLGMFLNAGWFGGFIYVFIIGITLLFGLRHGFKRTATQPLFLVIYAAFVGNALEGIVIDTDHWRHFYLLFGLTWGLMAGDRVLLGQNRTPARHGRLIGPVPLLPCPNRPVRIKRRARQTTRSPMPLLPAPLSPEPRWPAPAWPGPRRLRRYVPRRRNTLVVQRSKPPLRCQVISANHSKRCRPKRGRIIGPAPGSKK